MADNTPFTPGSGGICATRQLTISGDLSVVQVVCPVFMTGAEGSWVAVEYDLNTGTVGAGTQRVTLATNVGLPTGTNNIGDVDVLTVPTDPFGANADAASATGSISAKLKALANTVAVDDAAFTAASSSVAVQGVYAVALGSAPDTLDALDAGARVATRNRVPFVLGGDPATLTLKHTTITTAVTNDPIITISTGSKIVVTRITVTLDNASTVFPTILMGFATATTPTTTKVLYAHGGFPAGGGQTIGDGSGILGIGADDEDLRITTTGNATGNGLQITVTYHTVPS